MMGNGDGTTVTYQVCLKFIKYIRIVTHSDVTIFHWHAT